MKKLELLSLPDIRIQDTFFNKYTKLVTKEIIPYQWEALNDRIPDAEPSYCIQNMRVAAGLEEGTFHGWVFQDTDVAKWLEAVAYSLSYEKNEDLEKTADEVIELIGKAQQEDGYLNTYFSILAPDKRFTNLKEGHELYTAGHFIEAAVAYYKITGKSRFLEIVRKYGDLICRIFHTPEKMRAYPGHQEIELALVKLYEVTGEADYLNMAKDFIDRRGVGENYLSHEHENPDFHDVWHDSNPYVEAYGQSHLPVREQKTAEGHAVRAVYMYCAMADLAYEFMDTGLLEACENLWNNMVNKRIYITGGIGSSGMMERFTTDYDLENNSNYAESCASIGLALFGRRMAQITREAKYIDVVERALYNTVLSGIAMDGKSFFYVNPLEVWPKACMPKTSMEHVKPVRQKWFGCACCPPNITRTLASLGEYIYFKGEETLFINLFIGSETEAVIGGNKINISMQTSFPAEGKACVSIAAEKETILRAAIRIPDYAKKFKLILNGEVLPYEIEKGYAVVELNPLCAKLEISFEMSAEFMRANHEVRADIGKVCMVKGPVVYCLEQEDNGENLASLYVDSSSKIVETWEEDLLSGCLKLKAAGKRLKADKEDAPLYQRAGKPEFDDVEITAVPYCYWGNRSAGEMLVWIKEYIALPLSADS